MKNIYIYLSLSRWQHKSHTISVDIKKMRDVLVRLSLISKEISYKILANVRVFRFRSENDGKSYRLVSTLHKAVLKWSL